MSRRVFGFYCTCGGAMLGSVSPDRCAELEGAFRMRHSGDGHEPCDAKTARRARQRKGIGAE